MQNIMVLSFFLTKVIGDLQLLFLAISSLQHLCHYIHRQLHCFLPGETLHAGIITFHMSSLFVFQSIHLHRNGSLVVHLSSEAFYLVDQRVGK